MRSSVCAMCAVLLGSWSSARAQGVPGEIVAPGDTIATTTDADSARLNMGAVPLARAMSLRLTAVGEFQRRDTALDAAALTATIPLVFDIAASGALTWQHVRVPAASTGGVPSRGEIVTGEIGLAYALMRDLGIGARLRISGAGGEPGILAFNGAADLDLGVAWRPVPALSFGVTGNNLLGPRLAAIGRDRAISVGVGVRPTGSDAVTVGLDASYTQSNAGWVRVGTRVHLPGIGYARAEGVLDLPSTAWRASAGIELVLGSYAAGAGALVGAGASALSSAAQLGGYASVRFEPERDVGLPQPGMLVAIALDGDPTPRALGHLVLRLERMRQDPAVRGIVFEPRDDVGGLANAEELRDEFARMRARGMYVACHLSEPTGSSYYACAGADTIAIDPSGSFRAAGIRTAFFFLGDSLRDLGVHAEFVRIGAWKSAPEQFTRRGSTPEARAQEEQLMDDFYATLLSGLSDSRRSVRASAASSEPALSADAMRATIEAGPYSAREAFRIGLVDSLATRDAAERSAARAAHATLVRMDGYAPYRPRQWSPGATIAVVYVDGDMVDGENSEIPLLGMRFTGARTISALIDQLASNPSVAAIVLRIDSGGGSAMSAEFIWRAIDRATHHKPVIVSMGRMAASAAYYIAAPAREIVADASSITGSIGIFFGKADLSPLLTRLDVGAELLRRGPRADMDSLFRPWSDDERQVIGRLIGEFYQQFLERVAMGRHTTTDAINAVGEGRVFAGSRARQLGLVDRIGGLATALERARTMAGLDDSAGFTELPVESPGLLATLAALVTDDSSRSVPTAHLLVQGEARTALAWLVAVRELGGQGRPLAMTEWPMLAP